VAALVLDHAADVAITDSQRVQLESIRREQDSANRPWLQRLDSLRPTGRPANGPNDLSQEQRDEIAARRAAIAEIMEGMRETNAVARKQTMELLSEDQQKKAAKLEQEAKQQADEARDRGQQGSGGEGRRRGGRQG
jgi:regulator of protease activity HflC (stomatin/prohibitin superfamily)